MALRDLSFKIGWQVNEGPLKKADKDTDNLKNKTEDLGKKTEKLARQGKSGFGGLGSSIKSTIGMFAGFKIISTIESAFRSGIGAGMDFNSTMQQNTIAFDSMLGSATKTRKLMAELSSMAAKTPFELPDLVTASKRMLAFGFQAEQIPGMMKNIGDAASGLGLGADGINRISTALGQMRAKGKISGEEMLQLQEAGVPALGILADAFGKTTKEISDMQSKGLLPVEKTIDTLVQGLGQKFPNMMDKQSKSFAGLMSTMKDNVNIAMGGVLKPAFEGLTNNILPGVIGKLELFNDVFRATGDPGKALRAVIVDIAGKEGLEKFNKVLDIGKGLLDGFKGAIGFVSDNAGILIPLLGGVVGGIIAFNVLSKAKGLMDAFSAATKGQTIAQWALNAAMNANPIMWIALGIGAAITAGILLWKNWDKIKEKALQLWEGIKGVFGGIGEFIGNAFKGGVNLVLKGVNAVIRGINALGFKVPDWVPGIGGKKIGFTISEVPMLYKGTNFHKGGPAIVGEKGPELVNMPRGSQVTPAPQTRRMLSNNSMPVFSPNVQITVQVDGKNANPNDIANSVERAVRSSFNKLMEEFFAMQSLKLT